MQNGEYRFVRQSTQNDVEPQERGVKINGCIITTDEKRLEIAEHFYQRTFPHGVGEIPQYTFQQMKNWLKLEGAERLLSDLPTRLIEVAPGVIVRI